MGIVEWTAGYTVLGVIALVVLGCYCLSVRSSGSVIRDFRLLAPQRACRERPVATTACVGDVHLVMNSLNRLAAQSAGMPDGLLDQICNLADYLRHCLEHAEPRVISVVDELALAEHYVALVAGVRGWQLPMSVTADARIRVRRVKAHSICRICQTLLNAQLGSPPSTWPMTLEVSESPQATLMVRSSIARFGNGPAVRSDGIDSQLALLCKAMSSHSEQWTHRLAAHTDAVVQVAVCIQ